MNDFIFFLKEGINHILSTDAADHLLFLLALVSIFSPKNWKQILLLVTAFTIGHALTLILSTYKIVTINSSWVEFLIPLTIVLTAILNLIQKGAEANQIKPRYFIISFFGLIHGLGFANTIKFMLAKDQALVLSLFGFNLGVEIGQIAVVLILLLATYLALNILKLKQQWWIYSLNTVAIILGIKFMIERIGEL
jgi:hypothetical protein